MDRQEILAKSQMENQGQDFAELEAAKESMQLGWLVAVCLIAVVSVVNALVLSRMSSDLLFVLTGGSAAVFGAKYRRLRRRHELIAAAVYALAAAASLAVWILQLIRG